MMTKIDLREVVAFLRTLPENADVSEAAAERFPDLSVADLKRAIAIARAQQEDEEAAEREDEEETQRLERIAARANPPKGELLFVTLSRLAAGGDEEAAAALLKHQNEWLPAQARFAVLHAAYKAHPDWRPRCVRVQVQDQDGEREEEVWIYDPPEEEDHPERDAKRLIAWFEATYPAEAARITAAVFAGEDDDPPPLAA